MSMKVKVVLPNEYTEEKEYFPGITPEMILRQFKTEHPVYACRFNHEYIRLNDSIETDGELMFCDIRTSYANMAMQSGLTLLFSKSVHDVLGKNVTVKIHNSLSKGLFITLNVERIKDEDVEKIDERMRTFVKMAVPFTDVIMERNEALEWLKEHNDTKTYQLLLSAPDKKTIHLTGLMDEVMHMNTCMVPDSSWLSVFEVRRYRSGILLRYPHPMVQNEVPPFEEQSVLYDVFAETTSWNKLLGLRYVSDLNRLVEKNMYQELIQLNEALHEKKISDLADMIHERKKRIILIAGPSSSGKTSFAKRLCIQLRVLGLKPLYLGTDDYFVDRADMVPDENGNLDFESLSAVDINLFTEQMNALLSGKTVDIPEFDFIEGKKVYGKRKQSIENDQPIVIEGIHGLNPELTKGISEDEKFRIYISPLTELNIDRQHRIPTTDARMLRRMIRDHRTRGRDAARTIKDWASVRAGEDVNIFPYCGNCDVFFNSQCSYELAVIKKYAEPLLKEIKEDAPEYGEAMRLLGFLEFFVSLEDDSMIVNNSIIREFIGGSILV